MAAVTRIPKKRPVQLSYIPRRSIPDKEAKSARRKHKHSIGTDTNVSDSENFSPVPSQPMLSPTEKSSTIMETSEEINSETESKTLLAALNSIHPVPSQPILSPTEKSPWEIEGIEEANDEGESKMEPSDWKSVSPVPPEQTSPPTDKRPPNTESKTQLVALKNLSSIPSQRLSSPVDKRPPNTESKTQLTALKNLSSIPSQRRSPPTDKRPSNTESIEEINNKTDSRTLLTQNENDITVIRYNNLLNNRIRTKQIDRSRSDQFKQPTRKRKTICKIIIVTLIIVGILAAGILPPIFVLVLPAPATTTTTTTTTLSPCVSTTCIGQETPYHTLAATVIYPFNGNANDTTGRYAGTPINSPTYIAQSYIGSSALLLNTPLSYQCIGIPYVDLSSKSFTIEVWLYVITNSLINDYGIFSLCDYNSTCLTVSLRNGRFALSFNSMNTTNNTLMSNTFVTIRQWVHLAVVYDSVLYQQQIYINGKIDSISTGLVAPYYRTPFNSTAAIGLSQSFAYGYTFFPGRMNLFTISAGTARTACQIYNDATLTVYFPFDAVAPYSDYSVNLFKGVASNTTLIASGQIGQAIYFTTNTSYFQVQGFPEVQNVSTANPPFTFSLWVNPGSSANGGSIIHISTLLNGTGSICYDLLALTSTGALVVQVMGIPSVFGWLGPIIPQNTWTHVAVIYSQINGVRLFINAQLSISSSLSSVPYNLTRWEIPLYITLGNNNPLNLITGLTCATGAIPIISGLYMGGIDDFRLYNRELNNEELCVLANM